MHRLLLAFCLAISLPVSAAAPSSTTIPVPDFAYPQKVSRASLEYMHSAIGRGDSQATVRSLIDYTLAQGSIAESNLPAAISLIDSVASLPSTGTVTKAMLRALQATLYQTIYERQRWKYDRRTLPLSPLPSDITEWSGEQYRNVISHLYATALADSTALAATRITEWKSVVSQTALSAIYYPTLLDFIGARALSAAIMASDSDISPLGIRPGNSPSDASSLYAMLIGNARAGSAPDVNFSLLRLQYNLNHRSYAGNWEKVHYDAFLNLYHTFCDSAGRPTSQFAGDILLQLPTSQAYAKQTYSLIDGFLRVFPRAPLADCLRNTLSRLASKDMRIEGPEVTGPGRPTEFKVIMRNLGAGAIKIYDVSSSRPSRESYTFVTGTASTPIATIPVKASSADVPYCDTISVSYIFNKPGAYIAVPSASGASTSRRESFQKIRVSELAMIYGSFGPDRDLRVVSAIDGAPVPDVKLSVDASPYRDNSTIKPIGTTDSLGLLAVAPSIRGMVIAERGGDRFSSPVYLNEFNYTQPDSWQPRATAFTSLPLYHHGDTVEWSAVCYEALGALCRPRGGAEVKVVIRDANRQPLDTLPVFSDRYGRVNGRFVLPSEGLSGRFTLMVDARETCSFEVSDYKLPTFRLIDSRVAKDTPSAGDVTLSGRAVSYSGFPVQDAAVNLTLNVSSGWRWGASYEVTRLTAVTDARGEYSLILPSEVLDASPSPKGYFTATVDVTTQSGETQPTTISFSRGHKYIIMPEVPASQSISDGHLPLKAIVKDFADSTINQPVSIMLTLVADTLCRLKAIPAALMPISGLQQGNYTLTFATAEADTVRTQITLYNPSAHVSPCPEQLLWSPSERLTSDSNGLSRWLVAAAVPTHIVTVLSTPDTLLWRRVFPVNTGFNSLEINMPKGVDRATLYYCAIGNYQKSQGSINITRANSAKGLRVTLDSFRDHLSPGTDETITFRVTDLQGNGREAAVIAGIYDAALKELAHASPWCFVPQAGHQWGYYFTSSSLNGSWSNYLYIPQAKPLPCKQVTEPEFDTRGRSWWSYFNGGMGRALVRNMMMKRSAPADMEADEVVTEEAMETYDAAPTADAGGAAIMQYQSANTAAGSALKAESATDDTDEEEAEGASDESVSSSGVVYRTPVAPLALFRPDLVTDSDGRLALRFKVPDANASWSMQLIAWTDSMLTSSLAHEITVSRPLMVQPNMPRFVRSGDQAVIPATIMNAADTTLIVKATAECFIPGSKEVISRCDTTLTLIPQSSAIISLSVGVPCSYQALGVRFHADSPSGSDGEQSLVSVLPSLSQVFETLPFYLPAGGGEVSLAIPRQAHNGRISLQLSANPVWSVVTALPGLLNSEAVTSPEASRAIFAASIASGLLRDNPEIARALREWTANGAHAEQLTSMLQRNSDLKMLLLNSTPWMADAASDTERMQRLALLFDRQLIDKTLADNIDLLSRLSLKSGGVKWSAASDDASRWATGQVCSLMGRLIQLGFLPDSKPLKALLEKSLAYDTSLALKDFSKHPDADYSDYVWRHTLFAPLEFGQPDRKITASTIQNILATWRKASLAVKALDTRLLASHGYPAVAKEVLESIREFSLYTPEQGEWFPSLTESNSLGSSGTLGTTAFILEAFHSLTPQAPDADRLRQWLIMRKGAQNWGSSAETADIVASILTTSTQQVSTAEGVEIKVDGNRVKSDEIDRITGEWTTSLNAAKVAGKSVSVKVKAPSSSYGAIYCAYQAAADSVTARSCPQLSVTRAYFTPAHTNISPADTMSTGQRLTVLITLKVGEDMDYVVIDDERAACLEPVDQLPATVWVDGVKVYRISRDTSTRLFIERLRKGTYQLSYDVYVGNPGVYSSGIATAQSQYAPRFTAHSSGNILKVK